MDVIRQHVRLSFEYPVHFTVDAFAPDAPLLRDLVTVAGDPAPADAIVVVDDGVARAHPDLIDRIAHYARVHAAAIRLAGPPLLIPGGESAKNDPRHLDTIHAAIHDAALCRHSYVIAVGGGAVLDVAGYAAATAHRGVRLIRMPTTVLSQDDSGVGVKNGINAFGKKNYFGTFAPPFAVINDFSFLATLDRRDWLGGLSEAVKAGLVRDAAFIAELEDLAPALVRRDETAIERVIRRSAALHLAHIATGGDPFELGSSRPLDFGHWAAHRLEQLTATGCATARRSRSAWRSTATYSRLSGILPEADWRRIVDLLQALGLPLYAQELGDHLETPDHRRSVLRGLAEFREHLGGRLTVMLLAGIGQPVDVHEIQTEVMIESIETLRRIQTARSRSGADDDLPAAASARGSS